ncbi:MAG TPA: pitrilysin family protein [Terriglobia bacterium]|nr:pitrilysin family protein [Terriglobia bacterium]
MGRIHPAQINPTSCFAAPLIHARPSASGIARGVLLIAFLFLSRPTAAQVKFPSISLHTYLLPNGLQVVMAPDDGAPVTSVEVWYHAGSRDEKPGMAGFAHLFEHLMFDGTRNLAPDEYSNYIVRSGGIDNAYTTVDATIFWETVPSVDLPVALWLEADRMRNLNITQTTFTNEREVVAEEEKQRFSNQPYGNVMAALYRNAFTVSPYRHRPIGDMRDLDRATLSDVRSFYDTYYVPENATVVIVGNFDENQAVTGVEQYFGPLKNTGLPIPRNYPQEPPQTAERVVKLTQPVALPAFVEGYHMPADGTPDAYPLELAAKILADGESSWLFRRLVYQKQIAMQVDCEGDFAGMPSLFFVFAVMNPGHTPDEGEAEADHVIDRLKDGQIPFQDLERAKNEVLRDYVLNRQTAQSRADALGYDAAVLKDPDLFNTEVERLLRLSAADVARAARKYLVKSNMTLVEVYPEKGK